MPRLPTPGQDDGTWGDILNTYLSVEHNPNGSQKPLSQSTVVDLEDDLAAKVATDDSRLSDQRVPTDGFVTNAKVSASAAIDQSKIANLEDDLAAKADNTDLSGMLTAANNLSDLEDLAEALSNLGAEPAIPTGTYVPTAPGTTTVEGEIIFKNGPEFDPRAFGAVLATTATHQAAFQAAMNAASAANGVLVVPYSTPVSPWMVTGLLAQSNVEIRPKGGMPTIKLADGANPVNGGIIGNLYQGPAVENFHVKGICIDGNKANNTVGIGVKAYGHNISVTGCYIHNTPQACVSLGVIDAEKAGGKGNLRIERNWGHNPGLVSNFWGAFAFTGGDNVFMNDNVATTADGFMAYAFDVEPNPGWTVRRVQMNGNIAKGGVLSLWYERNGH